MIKGLKSDGRRAYVLALGVFLLLAVGVCHAQTVPSNLQAAIFFKLLSYDYNLSKRSGSEITIAVIIDRDMNSRKGEILSGFQKLNGQEISGKKIRIVEIAISDVNQLAKQVAAAKGDILYLAEGANENTIEAVLGVAAVGKCPTLGGSEALAQRGFAVGLAVEGGKPKIVVNLQASQKQGMNLSSKVLGLARVITRVIK